MYFKHFIKQFFSFARVWGYFPELPPNLSIHFQPFLCHFFLYILKIFDKFWFSDVFRECRKGLNGWNGWLTNFSPMLRFIKKPIYIYIYISIYICNIYIYIYIYTYIHTYIHTCNKSSESSTISFSYRFYISFSELTNKSHVYKLTIDKRSLCIKYKKGAVSIANFGITWNIS